MYSKVLIKCVLSTILNYPYNFVYAACAITKSLLKTRTRISFSLDTT